MTLPRALARANRRVTNRVTRRFVGHIPPFALLEHVGRNSGRTYQTPIMVFRSGGTCAIALTYGSTTEWVQNVRAQGTCTLTLGNHRFRLTEPRLATLKDVPWIPKPVRLILRLIRANEVLLLSLAL